MNHLGRISAVHIYAHMPEDNRLLNWAHARRSEIKDHIEQLRLEDEMLVRIMAEFDKKVCGYCAGSGHVMRVIEGCECDGPRQHRCDKCNGTGKPTP